MRVRQITASFICAYKYRLRSQAKASFLPNKKGLYKKLKNDNMLNSILI